MKLADLFKDLKVSEVVQELEDPIEVWKYHKSTAFRQLGHDHGGGQGISITDLERKATKEPYKRKSQVKV